MTTGCAAVDQVGQMNITGNVIPPMWYKNIKFKNGKPHFVAITLLSDLLYWYRPTIVRDEATGAIVKSRKKFKSDMLQRNYQSFADQFGFTKRQVKEAFDFLEQHKLITREFRNIQAGGTNLNNVMFLSPIPENIQKVTYEEYDINLLVTGEESSCVGTDDPHTLERTTLLRSNVPPSYIGTDEPITLERGTNTEITTKITTENYVDGDAHVREANPFHFYQENGFGVIGGYIAQKIADWCEDLSDALVLEAMKLAVEQGKKTWSYTEAILKSWNDKGVKSLADAKADQQEFQEKRSKAKNKPKGGYSRKPMREEKLPEWLQDDKKQDAQPNAIESHSDEFDFEAEKAKLEAELKDFRKE
jgi:DnaD/phage-associated family protein